MPEPALQFHGACLHAESQKDEVFLETLTSFEWLEISLI